MMARSARSAAGWIAAGRTALGAVAIVAPGPLARFWIGPAGDRPDVAVLSRAMGARDLAIGLGALLERRDVRALRRWLMAGAFADGADTVATLLAFPHLPRGRRVLILAVAGTSALACRRALDTGSRWPRRHR